MEPLVPGKDGIETSPLMESDDSSTITTPKKGEKTLEDDKGEGMDEDNKGEGMDEDDKGEGMDEDDKKTAATITGLLMNRSSEARVEGASLLGGDSESHPLNDPDEAEDSNEDANGSEKVDDKKIGGNVYGSNHLKAFGASFRIVRNSLSRAEDYEGDDQVAFEALDISEDENGGSKKTAPAEEKKKLFIGIGILLILVVVIAVVVILMGGSQEPITDTPVTTDANATTDAPSMSVVEQAVQSPAPSMSP